MAEQGWSKWLPEPGDTPPAPPYPEGYLEGLALFNGRAFWDCHEALEEIWLELDGGPKLFYQSIIQGAAAYFHVERTGRWHAARKLFEAAREKVALFRPAYMGLDTTELHDRFEGLRDLAGRVERGEADADAFDESRYFELWPGDAGVPLARLAGRPEGSGHD